MAAFGTAVQLEPRQPLFSNNLVAFAHNLGFGAAAGPGAAAGALQQQPRRSARQRWWRARHLLDAVSSLQLALAAKPRSCALRDALELAVLYAPSYTFGYSLTSALAAIDGSGGGGGGGGDGGRGGSGGGGNGMGEARGRGLRAASASASRRMLRAAAVVASPVGGGAGGGAGAAGRSLRPDRT